LPGSNRVSNSLFSSAIKAYNARVRSRSWRFRLGTPR
jgi:hypothetical protein